MFSLSTYRRPATDEARKKANAYRRKYRAEHPDKVAQWRRTYIARAAARMVAQMPKEDAFVPLQDGTVYSLYVPAAQTDDSQDEQKGGAE